MVEGKSTPYIRCTYYNERFQAQGGQEGELVGSFSRPRRSNECDQEHEYQGAHFNHLKLNSWMSHCWVKKSKYEHTKAFCASVDSPNKVTLNQWQRTHMARLSLEFSTLLISRRTLLIRWETLSTWGRTKKFHAIASSSPPATSRLTLISYCYTIGIFWFSKFSK